MRIEKNGMFADVPEDIAADLIRDKGWNEGTVPTGTARFLSREEIDRLFDESMGGRITGLRADVNQLMADKAAPRPEVLPPSTITEIRNIFTGGKEVPPDRDWAACPLAGTGTGLVEFRCINGTVQFRGTLKVSISSVGSHTVVRALPAGTERYRPSVAVNLPAYAVDTGTAYRIAMVRINDADGKISVAAPTGKFDTIEFDGLSYQVF